MASRFDRPCFMPHRHQHDGTRLKRHWALCMNVKSSCRHLPLVQGTHVACSSADLPLMHPLPAHIKSLYQPFVGCLQARARAVDGKGGASGAAVNAARSHSLSSLCQCGVQYQHFSAWSFNRCKGSGPTCCAISPNAATVGVVNIKILNHSRIVLSCLLISLPAIGFWR